MAMRGKYSRVDGRRSSSYCSTVNVAVFVCFCLIGVWMLMPSSIVPDESLNEKKQTITGNESRQFEVASGDVPEVETRGEDRDVNEQVSEDKPEDNQEEKSVTRRSDETTESKNTGGEIQAENEGYGDGKSNRDSNTEDGGTQKTEQSESEKSLGDNQSESGEVSQIDKEKVSQSQNHDNKEIERDQTSVEVFPAGDQSEILNETNAQNGAWSTQALKSQNETELQQSSKSKNQSAYRWKLCNATAGPDYIPCLDNWRAVRKLPSTMHYEHRERHCPEEAPTCVVPVPEGYKRSSKWPNSRDKIWYYNVPHTQLAKVKGHQNWVKVTGEYLTFPGGGTQFKNGAPHYIDFIQNSRPDIAWGNRSRVILDVGCGVASFGGYLFEKDVLTMSFAPKDEHEAQVQFALERGIPAILSVMGTKRLPFPSSVFDLIHCARCRVPWHIEGGKLLLELNRVLRPGGYFVWSATPVYQKLPEDVGIWKAMSELTKSMCWDLKAVKRDKLNGVAAAIYRKPTSNRCYNRRPQNEPPLCNESDDPNAAWNVPLQVCMHKVPVDPSKRGSRWPVQWPLRVVTPPYWLNSEVGVYGKAAPEDFTADYQHWRNVVSNLYLKGMGINWSFVRNIMDMRAVYGGFAAALKDLKVWVMNVVPIDSPDTLPIIYERGLFGLYHDWCESFNTYPRTYDLLHADHLLSSIKKRCNLQAVIAEVDRILRPEGHLVVRDNVETIGEVEGLAKSLQWEIRMIYSKGNEGLLCIRKTYWRPTEKETITSAII